MATNEGSSYTLITNSEFASEEWELNEAFRRSETEELPIESSAAIEAPLGCITSITNSNSETQIVDAIALDHVYHRKNSDAAPTVTECQPGLESPTCISLPELPILSNPKPALGDPINRPTCMGSKSPTKSSSILHSLHMDVKLAEPDNDHQGQNNNSARPESITSSHSLQRDSELAKPDSNCHSYNSNIEKEHNRPGPREQEEFLHQPFILGPVDDREKESNIEVNLLAPESYTAMVQQCFQEVNDTKSNGTNLQDPLQTKQPEETLQFGQEHTPQSNDVSLPPCQVVLSHKTLKSQASAMSSINDLSGHKLAKILRRDFRREVESFCVSYSNACVKKDKLMSGDDRDRGLCSEPGHCSVSTTMAEAHGPIPQEGIQYHESGPLVLDKLPLFSCKQCGSFFESEAILGHHHKLCLGVIVCESCMVIFAYKDALANLIPPGFVCKDCGLSFPSDCEHKRTDQLPWFKACLCQSDPKAKFFLGHRRACTLCNVFLQFPRMCNTCKCTKRRNVTNKQVSSRKKLLRGEWSVKAIKCCECNITFMTLLNFVQHLQLKDGTDDNLDSSLSTGGLCIKSNNVFTCKEHVQNHDCIVAPPKERPAAKKPMKKALLSAESTDCPKQRQRKIDGRLRKWEGRLDHTYSAEHSMKPTMCKLCRTFFSNHLLLEEHNKWHLLKDASVGSEKPSIRCLLEQYIESFKQTNEVDSQLHTMANVPKETSINPPVKPSTLCLPKVRKAAQDTERILQSSKKKAFDQLQQTQSTENIKQTSEKTDSQLHTMANVPKETSINPPVKPSTLCLQKVRKASQDTERILQSSKKNAFDQLQQTQSTENIKQTSEKTDSQLHTMANVFDETSFSPLKLSTTCLLKQPTGSIEKIPEGTTQSLLLWDMFRPDEKHPSKCLYHISRDKTALRDDGQSYVLGNIFQCIWCKKYFSLLKSFKQHKCKKKPGRTNPHLLINTYLCEYCGLSFAQHGNFMKHIVLHNDVQAGYELQQTQPIVNIKQTSKNTDSRPHAIESVLQELHVSPQKQSALSQLKQPKEIIKQTSVRSDSQRHQQQHLSTLSRPDYVPEDKMALRNNNTSCMIGKTPQCVWCKAYFGCQESFKQHECKVIPVRTQAYLCEYCGFFFKLLDNFTKHMTLHRCMQLDRCSPVLDSADTSDSIPETSNSCNRTTPFQCRTCSKAFAFESQLLRHKNLHRLESRRPVPKRERSELESGDESFGNKVKKVQSGKKGSRGEERFGWKFRIKGPDCETGSGTRRRGTGGKGNLQEGPKSAPRWGRKARAKVINVKHFFCSACNQGFYHPWQLRKHIALHSEFSCYKCNGLVFSSMSELNNHLFSGKHNEQVQSARHEKHGPESSAPQGNSAPSTPKELESVQSGYPKGRKISSMATGLKSVQCGKSRTSSRFSISQKIDLAPSGQSKGRTKTLSDKKMKSVQSGQRIGSNKSSKDKKIKSVRHGHSITKKDFSSRTKECSQIAPDVSATEPMVSAVETKRIYCNQCGKGFLQTCKLNFHMLTCSEFKCDKCDGLTFPSNAQLKIHMRAHTDQYKCPKCDAQFASQKILTDHTASHSDPVPHICDVCELAFNSLKSLKMHKIIYHF